MPEELQHFQTRIQGKNPDELLDSISARKKNTERDPKTLLEIQILEQRKIELDRLENKRTVTEVVGSIELREKRFEELTHSADPRDQLRIIGLNIELKVLKDALRIREFEERVDGKSIEELIDSISYRNSLLIKGDISPREHKILEQEKMYAEARHKELTRLNQKKTIAEIDESLGIRIEQKKQLGEKPSDLRLKRKLEVEIETLFDRREVIYFAEHITYWGIDDIRETITSLNRYLKLAKTERKKNKILEEISIAEQAIHRKKSEKKKPQDKPVSTIPETKGKSHYLFPGELLRTVEATQKEFPREYYVLGIPTKEPLIVIPAHIQQEIMNRFTSTNREQAGILFIEPHYMPDGTAFIEVVDMWFKNTPGQGAQVTYTDADWNNIDLYQDKVKKRHPNITTTWIHSHPNLKSVGPSGYDYWIMRNFFKQEYQPAIIIDPVDKEISATVWNDETQHPISCGGIILSGDKSVDFLREKYMFSTATEYNSRSGIKLSVSRQSQVPDISHLKK